MEGRRCRIVDLLGGMMVETSGSEAISTRLQRVAKLAKEMPEAALSTLAHPIDLDLLLEAYRRIRKDGAVGVDVGRCVLPSGHSNRRCTEPRSASARGQPRAARDSAAAAWPATQRGLGSLEP